MEPAYPSTLAPGELLPSLALARVPDGAPVDLRRAAGRSAPVVMLLHGAGCAECRAYLERLAAAEASLREWEGRVVAVVPEPVSSAAELRDAAGPPSVLLADPEHRVRSRTGIEGAGVLIADRWGELYFVGDAGPGHELPNPGEITDWLRFIGIQCPECEGEAW